MTLLDPERGTAEAAATAWLGGATKHDLPPMEWEDAASRIFRIDVVTIAALPYEVPMLATERLADALERCQSDDWGPILNRISPRLTHISGPDQQLRYWLECIVLDALAERGGCTWGIGWDFPVRLRDAQGRHIDVDHAVRHLAANESHGASAALAKLGLMEP